MITSTRYSLVAAECSHFYRQLKIQELALAKQIKLKWVASSSAIVWQLGGGYVWTGGPSPFNSHPVFYDPILFIQWQPYVSYYPFIGWA